MMVAYRFAHAMVVTADGKLWTFGCSTGGPPGYGDEANKLTPTHPVTQVEVLRFRGAKIVSGCLQLFHRSNGGRQRAHLG